MSEISIILSKEHEKILILINFLIKECEKIQSGSELNEEFFKNAMDFIRNYADKFHHAKEEDILFKELCKGPASENMHCNPIEQMLYEHNLGRDFVKEIEFGINQNDKKKVIENSLSYSSLLKEHISKEDSILYPMAEESLDDKAKKIIIKKFKDIESEKKLEIEKYLDFVDNLN